MTFVHIMTKSSAKEQTQEIMETNNGNSRGDPSQSDPWRAEIQIEMETTSYQSDQPPPYSEVYTVQPHTIIRETVIIQPPLKDAPMFYPCSKCYKRVFTKVNYVNSKKTHVMAGFIFGLTCWCLLCCLAFIPYLIPTFKKVEHYCPECDSFLGQYSKV